MVRFVQFHHPCVPPQERTCAPTLALCDAKSSVRCSPSFVQHLHWYVSCVSLSKTSPSSPRLPGGETAGLCAPPFGKTKKTEVIHRPLHSPLLIGSSMGFALSSEHCLIASVLETCLLLAPHPSASTANALGK